MLFSKGLITESVIPGTRSLRKVEDILKARMNLKIGKRRLFNVVNDIQLQSREWKITAAAEVAPAFRENAPVLFGPFVASSNGVIDDDKVNIKVLGQSLSVPMALLDRNKIHGSHPTSLLVDTRAYKFNMGIHSDRVKVNSLNLVPNKSLMKIGDVVERLTCRLGDATIDVTDPTDIMKAIKWNQWTSVSVVFKGYASAFILAAFVPQVSGRFVRLTQYKLTLSTILSQDRANRKLVPPPLKLTDSVDLYAKDSIEFLPRSLVNYAADDEVVKCITRYCRLANTLRGPAHAATKCVLLQYMISGHTPPNCELVYRQSAFRLLSGSVKPGFWSDMREKIPDVEVRKPPRVVQRLKLRVLGLLPLYSLHLFLLDSYHVFFCTNHVLLCSTGKHE